MKKFCTLLLLLSAVVGFARQADSLQTKMDSLFIKDQAVQLEATIPQYQQNILYHLNDLPSVNSYGATPWQSQNEMFIRGRNNPVFVHEGFNLNSSITNLAFNQFGSEFHFLSPEVEEYELDPIGFGNVNLELNQGQLSTKLKRPDYTKRHAFTFNSSFNFERNGAAFGFNDGNSRLNHLSYSITYPKWGLRAMATNVGQKPILEGTKTTRNSFGVVFEQKILKGLESTFTGYYYKQEGKERSVLNTNASEQKLLTGNIKYLPFERLLVEVNGGYIESEYLQDRFLAVDSTDFELSRFLKEYRGLSSQPKKTSFSGAVSFRIINREEKHLTWKGSYAKAKIDTDLQRNTVSYSGVNDFNFDALKASGIPYLTFFSQDRFLFSSSFRESAFDTIASQSQETFGMGFKWRSNKLEADLLANLNTYNDDSLQLVNTDQLNLRFQASYLLDSKQSGNSSKLSLKLARFENYYPLNSETGNRLGTTEWADISFSRLFKKQRLGITLGLYSQTVNNYPYPFNGDLFVLANNTVTATLDQILNKTSQVGLELQANWQPVQNFQSFDWNIDLTADFSKRTNDLNDGRLGEVTTDETYNRKLVRIKNHFKRGPFSAILGLEWNRGRQHYFSFSDLTPGHFQLPLSKDSGSPFASSFVNFFGLDDNYQPILFEAAARNELIDNSYFIVDRIGVSYAYPKASSLSLRALEFSLVAHKQRMIYNEVPLLNPNLNSFQFPTTLSSISINIQAVF